MEAILDFKSPSRCTFMYNHCAILDFHKFNGKQI